MILEIRHRGGNDSGRTLQKPLDPEGTLSFPGPAAGVGLPIKSRERKPMKRVENKGKISVSHEATIFYLRPMVLLKSSTPTVPPPGG